MTATSPYAHLIAGSSHSCSVFDEGKVKCWGDGSRGETGQSTDTTNSLGDEPGEMGSALPFVDLGTGATVTQLVARHDHTCALLSGGTVKCWGGNEVGELGLGDTDNRGGSTTSMGDQLPLVDLGAGVKAVFLTAGEAHNCALLDDGKVKCWGRNDQAALGTGDTDDHGSGPGQMGDDLPFIDLGTGVKVVTLASGGTHSCALLDDGKVKCWGRNFAGCLGLGDTETRGDKGSEMGDGLPFVDLGVGAKAIALSTGEDFSCALFDNGRVKCWGYTDSGQLGLGDEESRGDAPGEMGDALPFVDLGTGVRAIGIASGSRHSCALLENGQVKCWGTNDYGELGIGSTESRGMHSGEMGDNLPTVDLGSGAKAISLAVGDVHTCARLDNGDTKCWGRNDSGQLGLGNKKNRGDDTGQLGDKLPPIDLGGSTLP